MGYERKFTEEDVTELLGSDLSLSASLAALMNQHGDIRAFLAEKIEAHEADIEKVQSPFMKAYAHLDWMALQDYVEECEAKFINKRNDYWGMGWTR